MDSTTDVNRNAVSEDAAYIQEPGEVIKPALSNDCVAEMVDRVFGLTVTSFQELNSYDDKNYHIQVAEELRNPHIQQLNKLGYVLKVVNTMDTSRPQIIEAMNAFMDFLRSRGIKTHEVIPDVNGSFLSKERIYATSDKSGPYKEHLVVLKTYIPGRIIQSVPYTAGLLFRDGQFLGKMDKAIQDFHHPFYDQPTTTIWCMSCIPKLKDFMFAVTDPANRAAAEKAVEDYEKEVVTMYKKFTKGYIQGDPNEQNILVKEMAGQEGKKKEEKEYEIAGILDFADIAQSYVLFDLAINIAYLSIDADQVDQLDVGGYILAGYQQHRQLSAEEYGSLRAAVVGRLAQSVVLGAYTYHQDPSNTYVLTTARRGWPLLHRFVSTPPDVLYARWDQIQASYKTTAD